MNLRDAEQLFLVTESEDGLWVWKLFAVKGALIWTVSDNQTYMSQNEAQTEGEIWAEVLTKYNMANNQN